MKDDFLDNLTLDDTRFGRVNAGPIGAAQPGEVDDSPLEAIYSVAQEAGIDPRFLVGLAKLETRLGDATIKGGGSDTRNLFNVKDFSGGGIRALDKAEGSRDAYRAYDSYSDSARDLVGLLERRYPGALKAQTPDEFARALKAGGYATDPDYERKLARVISSQGGSRPSQGQPASDDFLANLSYEQWASESGRAEQRLVDADLPEPVKDRTGGQMAGDVALSLAQGGVGAIKSLTDLAGADNKASAWLDDASKGLQSSKSEYAKQVASASQQRIEDAKGQGTMAEVGAYLDAIWDAPLDMTAQAAGSLLPFLFTGGVGAGARALGMANAAKKAGVAKDVFLKSPAGQMAAKEIAKTVGNATNKLNIGMGVGMGLGGVKGQQYETTLKEAKAKGLSDEEAKKLATEAQAYGGSVGGTLQQLGGAALGGIGAATGPLERALSRIPSATSSGRGVIGRTLVGGLKEAVPEGMQGAQQAWAGNEAAVDAGVMDASRRFEGVVGQGVQEAVLSFPMGGVAGALEAGPATPPAKAPGVPPTVPQAPPAALGATAPPAAPPAATRPSAAPQQPASPVQPAASADTAAMTDADLNALIEAIDAADDDAVTDEQWTQYALAIAEANRRADERTTAPNPAGTYMPGPEVNANRAKEQPKVVLQNRDRSGAASVLQMTSIAANPDFLRIGPSTEMTTGAPVVFGDLPPNAITGQPQTIVDGKGDRIQAQYVVVDAGDLIPSNNADGTSVLEYENGLPGKLRAVAGNGRTAGIQRAYHQGTADQYRKDLIESAQTMGLDAAAIEAMQQPVLVRVMNAADVRDDMGDRTNISGTQRLSPVEQAANDTRRLNLADLTFDENGNPTHKSLRDFIQGMPDSEKSELLSKGGTPTRQAIDRLMAATFKQAYDSDELVDLYAQAPEPEARAILNAAGEAAGALAALKEMNPDFDVREAVADAVKLAVNASRQGMPLAEFAQNADLDIHPDAFPVARFLSQYANKPRQMANGLREWANDVLGQAEIDRANQSQGGLFGAQATLTREELFARLGNIDPNDQFSIQAREALAKREAEKSAAQELPQTVAIEDIPDDLQPEDVVEAPSDFDLEAQTPEQLQAQADERAAEEKRQRNAEQAAEAKAQADAEVDSFTLTGSDRPADANPSQGDLLAADQPQQGDVLNNVGQPFTSPKAAEIKAKKDGKGGQVVPVQGGYVVRMPQNMSGTPSGTIGTRTDAKAGPGFTAADVVLRDPIAGQKINDEWTAFSSQSGTLGIPRAEMPQVKATDRGAMVNFLKARGIDSSKEQLPPTALKPTQAEFSPAKVQEAADRTDGDRSIIVSADGYVVDGHHQWLAQRQKGEPINVIRLDQPISQVLDALKEMPSAKPEQKQDVSPANDGDITAPPEFASFEAKTALLSTSPELVDTNGDLNERGNQIARTPWGELSPQDRAMAARLSAARRASGDAYNDSVREQERQAERRRLQGDRTIQQANGKPFKKEANAQAKMDEFDLADTHAIQKVDGGFVLRQMPPAEQAERKRKAEGRESYTEAQAAVLAEMGIGENADGEPDATEEQWAEIDRRTAVRLGQKPPKSQPATGREGYDTTVRLDAARLPEGTRLETGSRGMTEGMVRYVDSDGNPLSDWAEDEADAAAMAIEQAQNAPKEKLLRDHFVAASNADAAMHGNDAAEMLRLADQRDALVKELVDAGYTQAEIGANSLGISVDEFNRLVKGGVYSRERGAPDALFPKSGTRKKKPSAKQAQESKPKQPPAQAQQAQAATEDVAQQSPQDFIPAPHGGLDYGEITPDMGKAMRRQAGKIRLQHGVQNADGTGWGGVHIEARHGKEIRSAGFESVEQFLADAFQNVDQVWKPGTTSQLIAVQSGRTGKVAFVQLEADKQGGTDFYRINSAFPANEKYVARKEKKEGWKPLWSRHPVPADASGASGFVGQSPEAGETTPTVSGQSGATSVPPPATQAQPRPKGWEKNYGSAKTVAESLGISLRNSNGKMKKTPELVAEIKAMDAAQAGPSTSAAINDVIAGRRDAAPTIDEVKAEANKPVESLFTGKPDPQNSAPMDELEGFKPGDVVDVPSRTIGRSVIELVYRRQMAGFDPQPMARIVGASGKKLDVLFSEITRADSGAADTPAQTTQPTASYAVTEIDRNIADAEKRLDVLRQRPKDEPYWADQVAGAEIKLNELLEAKRAGERLESINSQLMQAAKDNGKLEVVTVGDKKEAKRKNAEAEPANQSQAEDRAKQDAIKAHNLPQDTVFKPGKGVNGVGKWIAESGGTRGNLAESIDAAAQSLANAIESVKRGAEKSAQYNRLAESVAAKLKAGEQPSDVELRDLFGLEPGQTYVDQSVVGGFLVDYMGVSRNKIRTSLGVAAGDRTSDGGAKYPIAYPRKLHLAFGPDPKPAASDAAKASDYGAKNTLVSQSRAEELRAKLREKAKNNLFGGLDTEMMAWGTELAVFHLEAGIRKFSDLAAAMARDLGTTPIKLKPYLRSWYSGARDMMEDHGLSVDGMDSPDVVRTELAKIDSQNADAAQSGPEPGSDTNKSLTEIFTGLDSSGLPKAQATEAAKAHPQADLIEQVNSQFHDLLLDLMETQGVLEVNGQTTETEDNKSCL